MTTADLPRKTWGSPGGSQALLIHGLSSSADGWWQVGEHLADQGWYVTAVDLRGHGAAGEATSYAVTDFASDLLETWPGAAGTSWDLVVGHSLGAAAALLAAATEASWTKRLVLLDPVLEPSAERLAAIRASIINDLRAATAESIAVANPRWHDKDVRAKVAALKQVKESTVAAVTARPIEWPMAEAATDISAPTLLVAADSDHGGLLSESVGKAIAYDNPNVTFELVEGAGHSLYRDDPIATLALIDNFLVDSRGA